MTTDSLPPSSSQTHEPSREAAFAPLQSVQARQSGGRGPQLAVPLAVIASLLWSGVLGYALWAGDEPSEGALGSLLALVVWLVPLALIWGMVAVQRHLSRLSIETQKLQITLDSLRQNMRAGLQGGAVKPTLDQRLDTIAAMQSRLEMQLRALVSDSGEAASFPRPSNRGRKPAVGVSEPSLEPRAPNAAKPAPPESEPQASLALGAGGSAAAASLAFGDFKRALHFPEGPEDAEGFRALRLALEDQKVSRLIRSAQDVLTLLSQEGIFMDNLEVDAVGAEVWRRFAAGQRGEAVAALAGVRDRQALSLSSGRLRDDPVFRDAVHHFLRSFDKTFIELEPKASDEELSGLSQTRTVRAFMLLGRVASIFD